MLITASSPQGVANCAIGAGYTGREDSFVLLDLNGVMWMSISSVGYMRRRSTTVFILLLKAGQPENGPSEDPPSDFGTMKSALNGSDF